MKKYFLLIIFILFSFACFAKDSFNLTNIVFLNSNKLNNSYYLDLIKKKFGNLIYKKNIPDLIKFLYQTNLLENINVYESNNNLVLDFKNRYILLDILVDGNFILKKDAILSILKEFNVVRGSYFNEYSLHKVIEYIKDQYKNFSKFNLQIFISKVYYLNKYIKLKLNFVENDDLKVRKILFFGNKFFDRNKILSFLHIKEYDWKLFFLKKNIFRKDIFLYDLELIKKFYFNAKFLDFNIKDIKVNFIKKDFVDLIIYFNEGKKYTLLNIKSKNFMQYKEYFIKKKNEFFTVNKNVTLDLISTLLKVLEEKIKSDGYLKSKILVKIKKLVNNKFDIIFDLYLGKRFYVRKIIFEGNNFTLDNVLREYLYQLEGSLLNLSLVNKSKVNLQNSSFLKDVNYVIQDVKFESNKVDIIFSVKESDKGVFNFGLGYSKKSSLNYNFSASEKNFLGRGNDISFKLVYKNDYKSLYISYIYPYRLYDYNLYYNNKLFYTNIPKKKDNFNYSNINYGFERDVIWFINEFLKFDIGVSYIYNYVDNLGKKLFSEKTFKLLNDKISINVDKNSYEYNDIFLVNNLYYNSINDDVFPTSGLYLNINNKFTIPGSDNNFYKIKLDLSKYFSLDEDKNWIFSIHNTIGYGSGIWNSDFPFYENFFPTEGFVRGLDYSNIGPHSIYIDSEYHKCAENRKICFSDNISGGNAVFSFSTELSLPFNYFLDESYFKYLRFSFFLDVGNIWNTKWKNTVDTIKYNIPDYSKFFSTVRLTSGFVLKINSPLGPLNLSLGYPIKTESYDKKEFFQFYFGNSI